MNPKKCGQTRAQQMILPVLVALTLYYRKYKAVRPHFSSVWSNTRYYSTPGMGKVHELCFSSFCLGPTTDATC